MLHKAADALDVDLVEAIDHDLGDAFVGEQVFQRPKSNGLVQHFMQQRRAIDALRQLRLAAHQFANHDFRFGANFIVGHVSEVAPPQVDRVEQLLVKLPPPHNAFVRSRTYRCRSASLHRRCGGKLQRGGSVCEWLGRGAVGCVAIAMGRRLGNTQLEAADADLIACGQRAVLDDASAVDPCARHVAQVFDQDAAPRTRQPRMRAADAPAFEANVA